MVNSGIPWAFSMGNHDDQADLNRSEIVALDSSDELSLTEFGPHHINGITNYYLDVEASQNESLTNGDGDNDNANADIVTRLWFFDSGDTNCLGIQGWGCIYPDQIEWYRSVSRSLQQQYKKNIPSLAFFHIPPPEFMDLWNFHVTFGEMEDEGVCCFSANTGFLAAAKELNDLQYIYCGHDHINDFWGVFNNITLSYGRKTGYGGYFKPGWFHGARVIHIREHPFQVSSWIRQEDGSVIYHQRKHLPTSHPSQILKHCCGIVL